MINMSIFKSNADIHVHRSLYKCKLTSIPSKICELSSSGLVSYYCQAFTRRPIRGNYFTYLFSSGTFFPRVTFTVFTKTHRRLTPIAYNRLIIKFCEFREPNISMNSFDGFIISHPRLLGAQASINVHAIKSFCKLFVCSGNAIR